MRATEFIAELSIENRGLPPQIVALTITPGHMWGRENREEVELR